MSSSLTGAGRRPGRKRVWTVVVAALVVILAGFLYSLSRNPSLTPAQQNESNAIDSLHSILGAEDQYRSSFPKAGFACTLSVLGGDPNVGPPTPQAAEILPGALPLGRESGYVFNIRRCSRTPAVEDAATNVPAASQGASTFEVTAVPQRVGVSGQRGFCMDQSGEIKVDPKGGTNCTERLE